MKSLSGFFCAVQIAMTAACIAFPSNTHAQTHQGKMDTDGILSPGEIPNPRINYNRPRPVPPQPTNRCRDLRRGDVAPPRVYLDKVRPTGNFFGDKVKVHGTIEGVCLQEAGLFERGRKVESIPVKVDRSFRRIEFDVKAHLDSDPEIRVYMTNGERDYVAIRPDR